jgi:Holliday junction resolvase RusA-like endonuclease
MRIFLLQTLHRFQAQPNDKKRMGTETLLQELSMQAVIYGQVPSKSNGYRIGNNRLYKSKELLQYEESFRLQTLTIRETISVEFGINIIVYFQSNRSDLDNAAKVILDCLQSCGIIENDRLCVRLVMIKKIDKLNPRIEIFIYN